MSNSVIVVGAGAAGMMAAGFAAKAGAEVILLEKNAILGKKIRISGKGRCNITNMTDIDTFIESYPGNGKFLYGALHKFSNKDLIGFLDAAGLKTKVERGQRIFPVSNDADEVAETLINYAINQGVIIKPSTKVTELSIVDKKVIGVKTNNGTYSADKVIIATGGASYPHTGSSGDGYRLAKAVGHSIVEPFPALVGLKTEQQWVKQLSGLTLKNVAAIITNGHLQISEFGEMQFAHFGVTGPIILTLSRFVSLWLRQGDKVQIHIDLKPALTKEVLDKRILRDFQKYSRKQFKNSLHELLPKALIPIVIELSHIPSEKKTNQITQHQRQNLIDVLKHIPLSIVDTLPLSTAIVTAGGVHVKEIDPTTMESKMIQGLFFAGEVLDVDGITGGYNLQAAFSTGVLAGISAGEG